LFYFFKTQILKNPINSISLSAFWAVVCFCQRTDFDDYSLGMAATGPHTSTLVCGKQFQQLEYQAMQISLCFVGFLISAIRGRCQQLTLAQRRSKSRARTPSTRRSVWRFNDISGEEKQPETAPPSHSSQSSHSAPLRLQFSLCVAGRNERLRTQTCKLKNINFRPTCAEGARSRTENPKPDREYYHFVAPPAD